MYPHADDPAARRALVPYLLISILCAIFGAAFWCFFNFLTAEDSLVLYNRYNYLEDAPTYFYYAGYWSLFPQTVGALVSGLAPGVQAAAYSLVALAVFVTLLREIARATGSGLTVVGISVLAVVFAPFMLFNLTYSFWPGLAVLGLVGLRASWQKEDITLFDILICLPGLAGSPLGVLFFPLFAWAAFVRKSIRSAAIGALTLFSYLLLVDRSGSRSSLEDILLKSVESLSRVFSGQWDLLINTGNPGAIVMSGLGVLSVIIVACLSLLWILRPRQGGMALLLYGAGSLATVLAAVGAVDLPLSGRYWFPIVICATCLLGRFLASPALCAVRRIGEPILVLVLCVGMLGASALRVQSWGGMSNTVEEWSAFTAGTEPFAGLRRNWHVDDRWAIGLGTGRIPYAQCDGAWELPDAAAHYGFRIYCGRGVFE